MKYLSILGSQKKKCLSTFWLNIYFKFLKFYRIIAEEEKNIQVIDEESNKMGLPVKKEAGNNLGLPKNTSKIAIKSPVYKSQTQNMLSPGLGGAKKSLATTKSFNVKKPEKSEKAPSPKKK